MPKSEKGFSSLIIIIVVFIILILSGGVYFYINSKVLPETKEVRFPAPTVTAKPKASTKPSLKATISTPSAQSSPYDNPFETQSSNPFEDTYENPFAN